MARKRYFGYSKETLSSVVTHYMMSDIGRFSSFPATGNFRLKGDKAYFRLKTLSGILPIEIGIEEGRETIEDVISGRLFFKGYIVKEKDTDSFSFLAAYSDTEKGAEEGLDDLLIDHFFETCGIKSKSDLKLFVDRFYEDMLGMVKTENSQEVIKIPIDDSTATQILDCYPAGIIPGENIEITKSQKPGRNKPCPCGSGKKYKKCCGR